MNRKKLAHIIVGLPIMHTPDLMDPDVHAMVLERPEFSIRDIKTPVLHPNGMTNRQMRKHKETRKRKGRK